MNLDRAHRDLEAARHLLTNGFPSQAISRAYYSAFYAAHAALGALGEERSTHGGVISAFNRLVVKEGGLDRAAGRWLRRLFDDRSKADYQENEVDREAAERDVRDAERFVDAVTSWIEARTEG